MGVLLITERGARPGVEQNQAPAIQSAIDACHQAGGGRVVVPAGPAFVTGSLQLKSNVELHLESGAVLAGSKNREDYQEEHVAGEYGSGLSGFFLRAQDAHNVSVTGTGTIDQRGVNFTDGYKSEEGPYIFRWKSWRPRMIGFYGCRHVTFRDVTLRDAANWCLHMTGCEDVVIHGIRIYNHLAGTNCDGIDPDHCRNVRISDCYIESGDDSIVIKATKEGCDLGYRGSHNITVTGCTLISTSAAIKIGTESQADFSNILFNNCVVRSSSRGLAIQLRDAGNRVVHTRLGSENRQPPRPEARDPIRRKQVQACAAGEAPHLQRLRPGGFEQPHGTGPGEGAYAHQLAAQLTLELVGV
ncbi:MAG: glycoside hydrolase family 28 protein, partial [Pirellulales bacterium]|nr:glycoside hydrolase family 28 protein [Pirellulales bacterium]